MSEIFKSRASRALTLLHDANLRECVKVWKQAKAKGMILPKTADVDYQSLDHLMRHILRAARGYCTWTAEQLGLPDPDIEATPEAADVSARLDAHLEIILNRWPKTMSRIEDGQVDSDKTFLTRWKVPMTIESMLEHAVVHPERHSFQLQELMGVR